MKSGTRKRRIFTVGVMSAVWVLIGAEVTDGIGVAHADGPAVDLALVGPLVPPAGFVVSAGGEPDCGERDANIPELDPTRTQYCSTTLDLENRADDAFMHVFGASLPPGWASVELYGYENVVDQYNRWFANNSSSWVRKNVQNLHLSQLQQGVLNSAKFTQWAMQRFAGYLMSQQATARVDGMLYLFWHPKYGTLLYVWWFTGRQSSFEKLHQGALNMMTAML